MSGRILERFGQARREGRAAFIAYLTAGDPDGAATVELACVLDRVGTDVLELGVPFTDPIADGPVLQAAAARALASGTPLTRVFEIAREIRRRTRLGLVLFSYLNPLLRRGLGKSAREAREAGFDGVLVTDLPPEEARPFVSDLRGAALDTVFLVSPTSTPARMAAAARLSTGFLYVVSRRGTTGARASLSPDLSKTVARARRAAGSLPVAVGFGIGGPEAVRRVARIADGVVVGSALVEAAERAGARRNQAVEEMAAGLVAACRRPRP